MTDGEPPEVRRATRADVPAIAALLRVAMPGSAKTDAEVLRWQYPGLDDVARPGSWVTLVDGAVVAHSGGIAVPVVHGRRQGIGVFGADAATHPAYRRRGLFRAAAQARIEEAQRLGALITWSVPNPASVAGLTAAGLRPAARGRLRWLLAVRGRLVSVPTGRAAHAEHARVVERPLPAVARLCQLPAAGVVRDEAWWRWRYLERPGAPYLHLVVDGSQGPRGVAAARVVRRRGVPVAAICDWHVSEPAILGALLRGVAAHLPVAAVAAITLPGTVADGQLRALGARVLPRALEPQPLTVLADRDPGAWELSWGELDWV